MRKMKLLFSIICFGLLIVLPSFLYAAILLDRVVAVVNKEVITWSELYAAMEADASPQLKKMDENEKRRIFKENESFFLENLINLKLQLQEARNVGLRVSDEEIREAVENIMQKYSMSESDFRESLTKEGFTFDEYQRRLSEQIMISKVVSHQIRNKIVVTDKEVEMFIEEEKGRKASEESYHLRQIFFRNPEKQEERIKIEEQALFLLEKLKEGAAFEDIANKYSQDASAAAGGDLGSIRKGDLMNEFSNVLSGLKTGEISKPFWTDRGLHIIRLEGKTDAKKPNLVEEEARDRLTDRLFSERYSVWIKSLREKSFIEIRL